MHRVQKNRNIVKKYSNIIQGKKSKQSDSDLRKLVIRLRRKNVVNEMKRDFSVERYTRLLALKI